MNKFPFSLKKRKSKINKFFKIIFYFGGSASTRDDQYDIQSATF
jgi:hypothetical protein